MGFYYFSLFSVVPLGVAYAVLALIFFGIAFASRSWRAQALVLTVLGAVFLVLPIAEELWIAWHFGQACKQAGTLIHKKVQVDGFYDDTTHWWRQLQDSQYQPDTMYRFVESRDLGTGDIWRVERVGNEIKHFKIDRPTARYWYAVDQGKRVSHKVDKQQSTVTDSQSGESIAVYARISREAPWFFLGLDRPNQGCDGPEGGPHSKHSFLIYRDVLLPIGSTSGDSK